MATVDADLSDGFRMDPRSDAIRGIVVLATSVQQFSEVCLPAYGVVLLERIRHSGEAFANEVSHQSLADLVSITPSLRVSELAVLADTLGVTLTDAALTALLLVDRLGVRETVQGSAVYNLHLSQVVRFTDFLGQFFGASLEDAIGVTESYTARVLAIAALIDGLALESDLTPRFLLAVHAEDVVHLDPELALQTLFHPVVDDGFEITAAYVSPVGNYTTWAMNTRTGAVTEYRDYGFNSLAQVGNICLGASPAGLYELVGDDDDGSNIIASIRSGLLQFGGTHLSRLKAAYIAARGDGQFLLKIVEGDGREFIYSTDTRSGRSTKVHMGKGQRSRYFSFELVSTDGHDFDLDTIEFVPIVVQRRV